jgi:hypothetical protein
MTIGSYKYAAQDESSQEYTDEKDGKRKRLAGIRPYKAMLSGLGSKVYAGLLSTKSRGRLFGTKGHGAMSNDTTVKKFSKPLLKLQTGTQLKQTKKLLNRSKQSTIGSQQTAAEDDMDQPLLKSVPSSSSLTSLSSNADESKTVALQPKSKV